MIILELKLYCASDSAPSLTNANTPIAVQTIGDSTFFTCNYGYVSSGFPIAPFYTCLVSLAFRGIFSLVNYSCVRELYSSWLFALIYLYVVDLYGKSIMSHIDFRDYKLLWESSSTAIEHSGHSDAHSDTRLRDHLLMPQRIHGGRQRCAGVHVRCVLISCRRVVIQRGLLRLYV